MKKISISLLMFIAFGNLASTIAHADVGPKPVLIIKAKNMPDELFYMDLLVEDSDVKSELSKFEDAKYNQELLKSLRNYQEDGTRALIANGIGLTRGDIICDIKNSECSLAYTYRVPNKFKIILISENGTIKTSNLIEPKSFNSKVVFDYKTLKAEETPVAISLSMPFLFTCLLTLLIEGIVLWLFKFKIKENLKVFLIVNIATQVFLYIMLTVGIGFLGILSGLVFFLLAELIIFMVEAMLFAMFLKGHTKFRRVVYSLTGNFVSFIIGIVLVIMESI